jgi:hypothetical protein
MTPTRRISPAIQARVERLAIEGASPSQIERQLARDGVPLAEQPSRRTIQRIAQAARVKDHSGPWSLADAAGDEAEVVLPILRAYLNLASLQDTRRAPYLTKAEARWIIKVRRAAPSLHAFDVYFLARAYLVREIRRQETFDLDALLAFTPWDETERPGPHGSTYTMREAYRKGIEAGFIPPAPAFLMMELAGIDWFPRNRDTVRTYVRAKYGHDPDAYAELSAREGEPSNEEAT